MLIEMSTTMSKKQQNKQVAKVLASAKKPSAAKNPSKKAAKNAVRAVLANKDLSKIEQVEIIEKILMWMASPRDFPAMRLSNGWSSFDTALSTVYYRNNASFVDLTNNPSASPVIADATAYVFRDAFRAFVYPTILTSPVFRYGVIIGSYVTSTSTQQMRWGPLTASGTNKPHGDILYPGVLDGQYREYFWVGGASDHSAGLGGRTLEFTNTTGSALTPTVYIYQNGISRIYGIISPAIPNGGTQAMIVDQDAYYAVDLTSSGLTTGALGFAINCTAPATPAVPLYEMAHLPLAFLNSNKDSMDSFKITAASLMYTNEAAPINRQGKVVGCQLPRGRNWTDYRNYDSLSSLSESVSICAENGMYGFLKPTQPEDFNFKDRDKLGISTINAPRDAWYALTPDSDFLAISLKVTTTAGQDGYWTPCWSFEYRTTDLWREVKPAAVTDTQVDVAIKLLSELPQWHENPFHVSDIFKWFKDTMSDAYQVAKSVLPDIVSGAATAAKIGGAIIPLL